MSPFWFRPLSRRPRSAISLFSIPLPLLSRRCYSTRARSHTHTRARAGHARFLRNVISTRSFAYYISCKYIYIYISILYANISRTQPWLEFLIIIRFFNCSNFNSNLRLPSDTLSLRLSLSAETTNLRGRVARISYPSISDYNNNNNNNNSNDKSVLKSGRRKRCFLRGVHEFPLDFFAAYISWIVHRSGYREASAFQE